MAEATNAKPSSVIDWTADAAYSAGAVVQLRDGRAGVVSGDVAAGGLVGVQVKGLVRVLKTASMYVLPGSKLFWDHSADKSHLLHRQDRDFFLGTAEEEAGSSATTVLVDLNVQPVFTVGFEHGFASVPVETAGFVQNYGAGREGVNLRLSATAEAQKADALTFRGFLAGASGAEAIGHFLICVNDGGNNAALDISVGIANATHATDADTIAESLFVHLDGNAVDIFIESDDGTTEVAATDSTLNYTAGTPFLAQFDLRDLTDIQVYIDGVNVLPASVFKLNAATGPLKVLAHAEKTANATPANVSVLYGGVTTAQV